MPIYSNARPQLTLPNLRSLSLSKKPSISPCEFFMSKIIKLTFPSTSSGNALDLIGVSLDKHAFL